MLSIFYGPPSTTMLILIAEYSPEPKLQNFGTYFLKAKGTYREIENNKCKSFLDFA